MPPPPEGEGKGAPLRDTGVPSAPTALNLWQVGLALPLQSVEAESHAGLQSTGTQGGHTCAWSAPTGQHSPPTPQLGSLKIQGTSRSEKKREKPQILCVAAGVTQPRWVILQPQPAHYCFLRLRGQ